MATADKGTGAAAGDAIARVESTPPMLPQEPSGEKPSAAGKPSGWVKWVLIGIGIAMLAGGGWWYRQSLNYVSTDDAYVNGHVTFTAPRVAGQVVRVLVDDNNRVRRGDLLVQLDPEPFRVQQQIAEATVAACQADVAAAEAEARGFAANARTMRFALEHAIEDVDNQVALLKAKIATLNSQRATVARAKSDFDRIEKLTQGQAATQQQLDAAKEMLLVARAREEEALQAVYQLRVGLGLPARPETDDDLAQVPPDLDQSFSAVRQAQMALMRAATQLGVNDSFNKSPRQMLADFYKRDPGGDIDRIMAQLVSTAPVVAQAKAKLLEAEQQLAEANLNLKYTQVIAEIDGVVTRRNVNPGNNVVVGQNLMAIRSLSEIWVDANFKETQLADLRIGQLVDLEVDMYGGHKKFEGRISGFTMGTGSTLALLPAQNATGNFVKVVQRLPVRIEVLNYDPDRDPLFIGLSVEPRVRIHDPPTGSHAGKILQPDAPTTPAPNSATGTPAPEQVP